MPSALFFPIFGPLSEARLLAELSAEAEAAGWHGVFLWDHMLYRAPVTHVGDPWISMAAIASATEQITIGPMVTPLPRRRPHKLARECVALDRLSRGRFVLGIGTGGDAGGELTAFGEELDPVVRGEMLDEALEVLVELWSGEPVLHRGTYFVAEGATMLPTAVQQPRIPIWAAARYGSAKPLRRAARYEGLFPILLDHPDQLVEMLQTVHAHRLDTGTFDVIVRGNPDSRDSEWADAGTDPGPWLDAGATWWTIGFDPFDIDRDLIRGVIADGPPAV